MGIGVPEAHIWPKSLSWNWDSHEEVLEDQSEELGPRYSYLTQVSMLESLGHGIFMEKFGVQAKGRASQLPYLAVASVMKSFSWDPSFTLVVMSEIICPPWGNKRAERMPGSPQGGSWGSWPGSHRMDILSPLSWFWRKSTSSIPSTHSGLPESQSPRGWVLGHSSLLPSHPIPSHPCWVYHPHPLLSFSFLHQR